LKRVRSLLVVLHRYAGLFLGALLLLEALTGCAIVFEDELDRLLNPHLHPPAEMTAQLALDQIVQQASSAVSTQAKALVINFPEPDSAAYMVLFQGTPGPGTEPGLRQVFVHAHSGEVLGQRGTQDTVLQIMKRLHADLYLAEIGVILLLCATFVLLLLTASGPFLWYPKGRRPSEWFSIKWTANPVRRYFDLHKVSGFWLMPLFLVTAITSVYMLDPPLTAAAVRAVFPLQAWRPPQPQAQPGDTPLAQIAAVAQARHPDAQLANLRFPRSSSQPYSVELFAPNEVSDGHSGSIKMAIDPRTGAVLQETTPADYSIGDHIMHWQYPLHNGHAFGLAGRIVVFIAGAFIALLFLTGFYVWFKKKKASIEAQRRKRIRHMAPYIES
jgi:uncharacterized iron-regulated membrane protein